MSFRWLAAFAPVAMISLPSSAQTTLPAVLAHSYVVTPSPANAPSLPFQPIGPSDLLRLFVYDSPELSQEFRIDSQGLLQLPMLLKPIRATGLLPDELGQQITGALKAQHLFVNPIVDVAVVEYRSRSVTVAGAVKSPATIQDFGNLHLLDAIDGAGGLLPDAGPDITVEQNGQHIKSISVHDLLDGRHPELNIAIVAGATIRIPECPKVFVVGNVKQSGSFPYSDPHDATVLKVLAMSGGIDSFSSRKAYIYRLTPGTSSKTVIEVQLRAMLDRKVDDFELAPNDLLYIPTNRKLKGAADVLNHITGMGNTAVSAAIWSSR